MSDHAHFNLDVAKASGLFIPLLEFNNQLFIAFLLLAGGWRVFRGLTDLADLYQFILMSSLFFQGIVSIGTQFNNALSSMAGAERVFRLLDAKPAWEDAPDACAATLRGRVEFRDVCFAYVPGRPVLHHVSFVARPGQTVALVGHTGSGKTTIINLVAKFFLPTSGEILLDEATSAIDAVTERRIQESLAVLLRGRTSFIVAHRMSTIRRADQVIVLDRGVIVERGNHDTLLADDGVYANLYRQFLRANLHDPPAAAEG